MNGHSARTRSSKGMETPTNPARSTKEMRTALTGRFGNIAFCCMIVIENLTIQYSSFLRHLSFDIRHSAPPRQHPAGRMNILAAAVPPVDRHAEMGRQGVAKTVQLLG